MNIVVDGFIFVLENKGGIARIYNNILPLMCELNKDVNIQLVFKQQPKITYPEHNKIQTHHFDNIKRLQFLRPFPRIYELLKYLYFIAMLGNTRKKIWFSSYYTSPPFNWKGHQIVFVHDLIYERFPDLFPDSLDIIKEKKRAIESADLILCISNTTAKNLKQYYQVNDDKIKVIYLSHDDKFKVKDSKDIINPVSYKYLLYVGNRIGYKNFSALLSAYSAWTHKDIYNLILVGPNFSSKEKVIIESSQCQDKIILFTDVDDDHLCDLYNQADALVYPSLYEGFGIPLLEAMACGCPIVASRIPSTEEIAQDIPIYFEPDDQFSLISALDSLLEQNLQSRIFRGISYVKQFSWSDSAKRIETYFENVLDG